MAQLPQLLLGGSWAVTDVSAPPPAAADSQQAADAPVPLRYLTAGRLSHLEKPDLNVNQKHFTHPARGGSLGPSAAPLWLSAGTSPSSSWTMVLCEDSDCSVCFFPYSRMDRIPRVLHCRHTFCELCLEAMQQVRSSYLAVACPLCRRVTCIDGGLSLQEALWVDSKQWEQISEDRGTEAGEEDDTLTLEGEELETKQRLSLQMECVSLSLRRKKLRLPTFFRKFSLTKQHQESIVPGSNVEMKSWRRLSTDF